MTYTEVDPERYRSLDASARAVSGEPLEVEVPCPSRRTSQLTHRAPGGRLCETGAVANEGYVRQRPDERCAVSSGDPYPVALQLCGCTDGHRYSPSKSSYSSGTSPAWATVVVDKRAGRSAATKQDSLRLAAVLRGVGGRRSELP